MSITLPRFRDNVANLYPNGEFVCYRQRRFKLELAPKDKRSDFEKERKAAIASMAINEPELLGAIGVAMGLSSLSIFDKEKLLTPEISTGIGTEPRVPRGRKGITRRGQRKVRNAAYLLQQEVGRRNLSFLTLTVPSLPLEQMRALHEKWNEVVEHVRRKLSRALIGNDVRSGRKVIIISEIQEKRRQKTGAPVLHIHALFPGRNPGKGWALTTGEVDNIWRETIALVTGANVGDVRSACRIESVKKSASDYLGKYMSKGVAAIGKVADSGYASWLPKCWYSMARCLLTDLAGAIQHSAEVCDHLLTLAESKVEGVFKWSSVFYLEIGRDRDRIPWAFHGRLTEKGQGVLRIVLQGVS